MLLVDRSQFPREKACGDGLTAASITQLARFGVAASLDGYRAIHGTRLTQGAAEHVRVRPGASGRVVPRFDLDALLAAWAAQTGAHVVHGARALAPVVVGGKVRGVRLRQGGSERTVAARYVVAADGATSALVRAVAPRGEHRLSGVAVRGYADGVDDPGDCFRIFAPLRPEGSDRTLAGYGWLFPLADGRVNVGVGVMRQRPGDHGLNLRELFSRFVADLAREQPGLHRLRVTGELRGAPLPCDFDPGACLLRGMLAVGDAANLVDPLTGEGIGAALESGAIAAEVVGDALAHDARRVADYPERIEAAVGPRIRAARTLVENHEFVWQVLGSTATVDLPLINAARGAVTDYDRAPTPAALPVDVVAGATGDAATPDCMQPSGVAAWVEAQGVAALVRAARDRLDQLVETDLPLLGPAAQALRIADTEQVRMATLLLCADSGGRPAGAAAVELAVCVELAALACRAHDEVIDGAQVDAAARSAANVLAVSVGDMALFRAYAIAALAGGRFVVVMSRACAEVCRLSVAARLGEGSARAAVAREIEATFFELAAVVGALRAGAAESTVTAAAARGRRLGQAWHDRDPAESVELAVRRAAGPVGAAA